MLGGYVASAAEEAFEVCLVDVLVAPVVNGVEGLSKGEIVGVFEGALHLVHLKLVADLSVKKLAEGPLDAHWEELAAGQVIVAALGSGRAQVRVVAG